MSIPKIDPYPPAPTPEDDEATFDDKAYAHAASLELRRVQMNEVASYVNTRASDANNRALAAASSATDSANSAVRADEWANKAPGSVVASGKYSARHYADLSDKFANAAEDVEVAPGKYSAQHYMEKAKKIADVHATTVETDPLPTVLATNVQEALRDLAYQADQLRVAKNQLKYGDGPYPVLDFQFAGAKYLDPRIQFTRASADWDENGREYGINEPVITTHGLRLSEATSNLILQSNGLNLTPWVGNVGSVAQRKADPTSPVGDFSFDITSSSGVASVSQQVNAQYGKNYTISRFVRFASGLEEYRFYVFPNAFDVSGVFRIYKSSDGSVSKTRGLEHKKLQNGWYRIWLTMTAIADTNSGAIQHQNITSDPSTGTSTAGVQFEESPYPTPYKPTESSYVTVGMTRAHIPLEFSIENGVTVFSRISLENVDPTRTNRYILTLTNDGFSEYISIHLNPSGRLQLRSLGATYVERDLLSLKGDDKIAYTISPSGFIISVNGSVFFAEGAGVNLKKLKYLIPNNLTLSSIGFHTTGTFKNLGVFGVSLTSKELEELTK